MKVAALPRLAGLLLGPEVESLLASLSYPKSFDQLLASHGDYQALQSALLLAVKHSFVARNDQGNYELQGWEIDSLLRVHRYTELVGQKQEGAVMALAREGTVEVQSPGVLKDLADGGWLVERGQGLLKLDTRKMNKAIWLSILFKELRSLLPRKLTDVLELAVDLGGAGEKGQPGSRFSAKLIKHQNEVRELEEMGLLLRSNNGKEEQLQTMLKKASAMVRRRTALLLVGYLYGQEAQLVYGMLRSSGEKDEKAIQRMTMLGFKPARKAVLSLVRAGLVEQKTLKSGLRGEAQFRVVQEESEHRLREMVLEWILSRWGQLDSVANLEETYFRLSYF